MSLTKRMIDQLPDREYEELFGRPEDWPVNSPGAEDDHGELAND